MKETHIATLQAPRSSWYFGCDVHGEERRERLTTFSGCDIVIAVTRAMIGSPRGVRSQRWSFVRCPLPQSASRSERRSARTLGTARADSSSPAARPRRHAHNAQLYQGQAEEVAFVQEEGAEFGPEAGGAQFAGSGRRGCQRSR